jgi:hypothetical protein
MAAFLYGTHIDRIELVQRKFVRHALRPSFIKKSIFESSKVCVVVFSDSSFVAR